MHDPAILKLLWSWDGNVLCGEPVMCMFVLVIGNLSIPEIVGIVVAGVSVTAIVLVILVISK